MKNSLNGRNRTSYCGEFTTNQIGDEVVAMGWVAKRRDFGNLVFIDLRDKTGIVQVVFNRETFQTDFSAVDSIRNEYVLCVEGQLEAREKDTVNDKIKTGKIEIKQKLTILSVALKQVPFSLTTIFLAIIYDLK